VWAASGVTGGSGRLLWDSGDVDACCLFSRYFPLFLLQVLFWVEIKVRQISTTCSRTTSPRSPTLLLPSPVPRSTRTRPSALYPWKSASSAVNPLDLMMDRNYLWCFSRAQRKVCIRNGTPMPIPDFEGA
jgi:hypothetical protein